MYNHDEEYTDIPGTEVPYDIEKDETIPKLLYREFSQTQKLIPNALTNKKIIMRAHNCEVKKGGFFSSDYLMY